MSLLVAIAVPMTIVACDRNAREDVGEDRSDGCDITGGEFTEIAQLEHHINYSGSNLSSSSNLKVFGPADDTTAQLWSLQMATGNDGDYHVYFAGTPDGEGRPRIAIYDWRWAEGDQEAGYYYERVVSVDGSIPASFAMGDNGHLFSMSTDGYTLTEYSERDGMFKRDRDIDLHHLEDSAIGHGWSIANGKFLALSADRKSLHGWSLANIEATGEQRALQKETVHEFEGDSAFNYDFGASYGQGFLQVYFLSHGAVVNNDPHDDPPAAAPECNDGVHHPATEECDTVYTGNHCHSEGRGWGRPECNDSCDIDYGSCVSYGSSGDCCSANGTPGCSYANGSGNYCALAVCSDPDFQYCCDSNWDQGCVDKVKSFGLDQSACLELVADFGFSYESNICVD